MFKTKPHLVVFAAIVLFFAITPWIPAGIIPAIIPAAAPVANKRGTSNVFQLALNNSAATAGTPFCDDGSGNATTSGCTGGGGATGVLFSGSGDPGAANPVFGQAATLANNTFVLAYAGSVTSGNLLVATLGWNGTATDITTISDTRSSTWLKAASCGAAGSGVKGAIYYAVAGGSGADTVTWTVTGGIDPVTGVQEFSGMTGTLDTATCQVGSNASLTTAAATEMLVSGLSLNHSGSTCTAPGSSILDSQANGVDGVCVGHRITGVAGLFNGDLSSSTNADTVFVNAAFTSTVPASPGNNGDWYWNTTTGVLWGPKTAGAYAKSSGSFISQTGSNGQFVLKGSPTMGTCGSSPSLATGASNNSGTINVGSGVVTACTLNFSPSFTNTPTCQVSDNSTAVTAAVTAVSVSAVTFSTSATLGSGKIYYSCF